MTALRWMVLVLLVVANLVVTAWLLGWTSWMPFPHETPREPERTERELRPNAITVLPSKATSDETSSSSSAPSR